MWKVWVNFPWRDIPEEKKKKNKKIEKFFRMKFKVLILDL